VPPPCLASRSRRDAKRENTSQSARLAVGRCPKMSSPKLAALPTFVFAPQPEEGRPCQAPSSSTKFRVPRLKYHSPLYANLHVQRLPDRQRQAKNNKHGTPLYMQESVFDARQTGHVHRHWSCAAEEQLHHVGSPDPSDFSPSGSCLMTSSSWLPFGPQAKRELEFFHMPWSRTFELILLVL
jgi:hypothetical protein